MMVYWSVYNGQETMLLVHLKMGVLPLIEITLKISLHRYKNGAKLLSILVSSNT